MRRLPAVSYLTGSWSKGKSETTAISLGEHIEVLLMGNECYNKFQINNYLFSDVDGKITWKQYLLAWWSSIRPLDVLWCDVYSK